MASALIRPGIYAVGAKDWDRRLFDSLISLPDGTSYNSYLIKGSQKTALLDTVDPAMESVLLEHLKDLGIEKIDLLADFWPHGGIASKLGLFIDKFGFSERANVILDEQRKAIFVKVYPIKELPDINEVLDFLKK